MSALPIHVPHALDPEALTCRAIVETPRGSKAKFTFDPDTGLYRMGKMMPAGFAFPHAFGFVPSTLGGDEDPLDILIIADVDLPVSCMVDVRLLGLIEAEQSVNGEPPRRNDRLIARPVESHTFAHADNLEQLGRAFIVGLVTFFTSYKALRGQRYEVLGVHGPAEAAALIAESSV